MYLEALFSWKPNYEYLITFKLYILNIFVLYSYIFLRNRSISWFSDTKSNGSKHSIAVIDYEMPPSTAKAFEIKGILSYINIEPVLAYNVLDLLSPKPVLFVR